MENRLYIVIQNIIIKMKKLNLLFSAIMIITALNLNAQCVNTSTINISTGFDPVSQTWINAPGFDPMWKLIAAPPSVSGQTLNINGPAHVIPTSTSWADADFPGSDARYISPYNTSWSTFEYDNYPTGQAVIFERAFCICTNNATDVVSFDLKLNADNWGAIDLVYPNGTTANLITQVMPTSPPTSNFADNSPDLYTGSFNLPTGTYKLRASLRNNGSISGLSLYGFINSSGLISDSDCSDSATIAGYKFNDVNQNGVHDPGTDPALANWTIELKDAGGTVISSTQTDGTGFYSFSVPAGSYIVQEVNQAGWTMVLPSNGTHNITVGANSINQLDFLNSQGSGDPCDEPIDFKVEIFNCAAQFDMSAFSVPAGFYIVDIDWDFGDGNSSSEANPIHYYANPGVYQVCLKVKIFDGKEKCCDLEICKEIEIREKCPEGCEINAKPFFRGDRCQVSFFANPDLMGAPITSYFWVFGDGSTSTQVNPVHTYSQSGVYNVTLFIFGVSPDGRECCFREFRMEVQVDCKMGKKSTSIEDNESIIHNVGVFPNPSKNDFRLTFETLEPSDMEVQIYDLQGRLMENIRNAEIQPGVNEVVVGKSLPSGMYILQLKYGDEIEVLQLVKQ